MSRTMTNAELCRELALARDLLSRAAEGEDIQAAATTYLGHGSQRTLDLGADTQAPLSPERQRKLLTIVP